MTYERVSQMGSYIEDSTLQQQQLLENYKKQCSGTEQSQPASAEPIYSHSRYAQLLSFVSARIQELSALKGGEYAGDEDRLANFRRNGKALGVPMELIWAVYCNKHLDAIMQYIKDLVAGTARSRAEPIQGRIDDAIVYLILLKAILDERGGENELKL